MIRKYIKIIFFSLLTQNLIKLKEFDKIILPKHFARNLVFLTPSIIMIKNQVTKETFIIFFCKIILQNQNMKKTIFSFNNFFFFF